ncbi:alpha-D-glucose phosphate-specific phosphoglucomutase [Roseibium sediminicola]|uniref:phosphoglucomutase (alpha-D-glucose-1,6-bisphosphate-dependent) n=1 Tax=Roseibium sediminicola TaxID=2933272 RepID=A0ABT0GZ90_9HYPH|nr:alpha-D-glucose phosphate-specific phosphoglucomutase [Roseibium sp. CAU 1639]MCK7614155.1 alpha-D-glucose phosphate-specific phosphoglucomutase [Roseibium sp. CAU 1639]
MTLLADPFTEIAVKPFPDQKPGTSGLRKKVARFQEPHYIETFVQAIFDTVPALKGGRLVLGGDGRYLNAEALQIILRMAAANGVRDILIGRDGILSTPAASHLIRLRGADAGIILSASHNPGGPGGDFGIKLNMENGGPASETVTRRLFERTRSLTSYKTLHHSDLDLSCPGQVKIGPARVEIVDPVADYADLMATQFDFEAIRRYAASGAGVVFDAMNAVTGPYAKEIFEQRLGFPEGTVWNGEPLTDFGGCHPDPTPVHAKALLEFMTSSDGPAFGAASDGDGDRNLVFGRGGPVSPSDSLALLTEHAHLVPAFRNGLTGVARSMPTSSAVDRVAEALELSVHETPTGWKFFGNLLDAGLVGLCGEESAGTGGAHIREKDGLWAVLFWLNILAVTGQTVEALLKAHWSRFGRTFYVRHDYEDLDQSLAQETIDHLAASVKRYAGVSLGGLQVKTADVFEYQDPVAGEVSKNQGLRFQFRNSERLILRLSGTGTSGATLRIYMERHETAAKTFGAPVATVLAPLRRAYKDLLALEDLFGRSKPDAVV